MRQCWNSIVLGAILIGLGFVFSMVRDQAFAQNVGQPPAGPQVMIRVPAERLGIISDFETIDDPTNPARKIRVITVLDPVSKRLCVYHGDMLNGTVKLCSVRNIQHDLMLEQFNPEGITPVQVEESIRRIRKQN